MTMITKKRDTYFDALKGFLIILVLLGHFGGDNTGHSNILWMIEVFIYIFLMPLFVLISGYFSRDLSKNDDRAVKTLIMFAVCQIAWMIFSIIMHNSNRAIDWLIPGPALWYLIALAVWRGSLKALMKIKFIIPISFALGIFSMFTNTLVPILGIPRIIGFLPFFLMGVYLQSIMEIVKKIPMLVAVLILVLLLFLSYGAVSYFGSNVFFVLSHNYNYIDIGLENIKLIVRLILNILSYAFAIIGSASVMRIAMCFKENKVLIYLGKRTLPIYILSNYIQHIVLKIQWDYDLKFKNDYINYALSIAFIVITLIICSSDIINKLFTGFFERINRFFIKTEAE